MNEIGNSIAEAIRKRTASAALGTYTFFWFAIHWQGVYTTLFVDERNVYEKFGLLKNEYVNQYFFSYNSLTDWLWNMGLPLVLTVIFIWVIQKFALVFAYREEQSNKTKRRQIRLVEEQKVVDFEKGLTKKKSAALDAKIELTEKTQEAAKLDPQIAWSQEFEDFEKDSAAFDSFSYIIDAAYGHMGNVQKYFNKERNLWIEFQIPKGALAVADSRGLIRILDKKIELTDKGRYFVGRYPVVS